MDSPTDAEIYAAWTKTGPALDTFAFVYGMTREEVQAAIERQIEQKFRLKMAAAMAQRRI